MFKVWCSCLCAVLALTACDSRGAGYDKTTASRDAAGMAEEAQSIIPKVVEGTIKHVGSVRIGCDSTLRFSAPWTAAVSLDGTIAAVETCDEILIINTTTGSILQRASLNENAVVDVLARAQDVEVFAYRSSGQPGFLSMSAAAPLANASISMPSEWRIPGTLVQSVTGTDDGHIVAMDICSPAISGCNATVVFDVEAGKTLLQKTFQKEHVTWKVLKDENDYVLATDLRAAQVKDWAVELVNLTSGKVTTIPRDEFNPDTVASTRASCNFREIAYNVFVPQLRWPNGKLLDLSAPSRGPITACTVSADGRHILVAVAPVIHRFDFQP